MRETQPGMDWLGSPQVSYWGQQYWAPEFRTQNVLGDGQEIGDEENELLGKGTPTHMPVQGLQATELSQHIPPPDVVLAHQYWFGGQVAAN